jgi:hypothetical protein
MKRLPIMFCDHIKRLLNMLDVMYYSSKEAWGGYCGGLDHIQELGGAGSTALERVWLKLHA